MELHRYSAFHPKRVFTCTDWSFSCNSAMKYCPEVSQASTLSSTHRHRHSHTHLSGPVRSAPMTSCLYAPDSFCHGDVRHARTRDAEMESEEGDASSTPSSGAWADVGWHGPNRAAVFLRCCVKRRGRIVRPYLLPVWRLRGKRLWRRHLVGVSGSQAELRRRGRRRETWKKGLV